MMRNRHMCDGYKYSTVHGRTFFLLVCYISCRYGITRKSLGITSTIIRKVYYMATW